jgi:hypothetical protein
MAILPNGRIHKSLTVPISKNAPAIQSKTGHIFIWEPPAAFGISHVAEGFRRNANGIVWLLLEI